MCFCLAQFTWRIFVKIICDARMQGVYDQGYDKANKIEYVHWG